MNDAQIKEFRKRAKQAGKSDAEIDTFIQLKMNQMQAQSSQSGELFSPRQPAQEEPKKEGAVTGFLKGVVKDIANPFLRAGVGAVDVARASGNLAQAVGNKITGDEANKQRNVQEGFDALRSRNLPFFGEIKPLTGVNLDTLGAGISAGSNFIGGEGAVSAGKSLVKGALKSTIKTGIKQGAVTGTLAGLGSSLQKDDKTAKSVLSDTATGALGGAVIGGAAAGIPAAGVGAARLVRGVGREIRNVVSPEVESALIKAIKPSINNTEFKSALIKALPDLHETSQLAQKPITSLDSLAQAIKATKNRVWDTYQTILGPNADATIDGNSIADSMISGIDRRFIAQNPGRVEKIFSIAETYRKPLSLKDAEDFLQSANNDLYNYYAKNKVGKKVALGDPETAYIVREAEALRQSLYDKLNELTGKNAAVLKSKYGALSNIENEVLKRINVAARQNPIGLGEQVNLIQSLGTALQEKDTVFGVVKGAAQATASHYLKNKNTPDVLIREAFSKLVRRKR